MYFHEWGFDEHEVLIMMITVHVPCYDNVRPKEESIDELEKSWQLQIKKKTFDIYILLMSTSTAI